VQADDQTQQGGLAGAIGAEQAEDATGLQTQGNVVERDLASV
jgi:hypothetical protein